MQYCKGLLTSGEIEKLEFLDFLSYKMDDLSLAIQELKLSGSAYDQKLCLNLSLELEEYKRMYDEVNSEGVQHVKVEEVQR